MRLIIAGSRSLYLTPSELAKVIEASGFEATGIISGGARGMDRSGEEYGRERGLPVEIFPADWNNWGKAAGHIRNQEMAAYGHALIAVWDGESRGTANMIAQMKRRKKPVYIHLVRKAI